MTETLFAVGAGDQVVGVSDLSDFPAAARRIPRIGSYLKPNVEAIVALRPDVVIAVPSPGNREAVESLESLGLRVSIAEEGPTVGDVMSSIQRIADEAGRSEAGRSLATRLLAEIDAIRQRVASLPRKRVLWVVGENPLVVVGDENLLDELLRDAGGANVASGLGRWPRLSVEFVIRSRPQVFIDSSMGDEAPDPTFYANLGVDPARSAVHGVRLDEVLRPGPRLGDGLARLARLVHPEAFPSGEGAAPRAER